jgi:cob(I)alamin adenosyltransferase
MIFEALGATDEVNAHIGLSLQHVQDETLRSRLEQIQCLLLDLGSTIATPTTSANENQLGIADTNWFQLA